MSARVEKAFKDGAVFGRSKRKGIVAAASDYAAKAVNHARGRTLTLYRDDSTVQVVFENVKAVFWTAGNTVLVISQYTDLVTGAHKYIHWPRERFCWFKDEPRRAIAAAIAKGGAE